MSIEIKDWHSVHLFYSSVCDDFLCSLLMRAAFVISHRYSRGEKTQTHSKQTHCFPEAHTLVLRLRFSGGSLSVALHLAISVCVCQTPRGRRKTLHSPGNSSPAAHKKNEWKESKFAPFSDRCIMGCVLSSSPLPQSCDPTH